MEELKQLRTKITKKIELSKEQNNALQLHYKECIHKHNSVMGLDAFHFQIKLLEMEPKRRSSGY